MRLVQPADPPTGSGIRATPRAPRLIAAAPAVSLTERWRVELAVLQRRSPGSDAAATLADCLRELIEAINAGDDVTLQLTIADAHAISRIPLSTLRWLCKHESLAVGARKREGIWYLDRLRFHEFLDSGKVAAQRESMSDAGVPTNVAPRAGRATTVRAG